MKRSIFIAVLTVFLLSLLAWPGFIMASPPHDQPYPPPFLGQIDNEINLWWSGVLSYQLNYKTQHDNKFHQMLWSHTMVPADEEIIEPDRLGIGPTDQEETGTDIWILSGLSGINSKKYRMKVDTYTAVTGSGYVVTIQYKHSDDVWQKTMVYGPETYRVQNWTVVTDIIPPQ